MADIKKSDSVTLLREGLAAASAGDRERARQLFLQVAQDHPSEEMAWMCLAEVSDKLSGRITNLRIALAKDPGNPRALAMLKVARQHLAARLSELGSKQSDPDRSLPVFLAAVDFDPENKLAASALMNAPREDAASQTTGPDPESGPPVETSIPASRAESDAGSPCFPPLHESAEVRDADNHSEDTGAVISINSEVRDAEVNIRLEDNATVIRVGSDDIRIHDDDLGPASLALDLDVTLLPVSEAESDEFSDIGSHETLQSSTAEVVIDECEQSIAGSLSTKAHDELPSPIVSTTPNPSQSEPPVPFTLKDALAGEGECSFCMELLNEEDGRCVLCGGTKTIADPRLDETIARVDPRLMLLAVNRLTLAVKRAPQDPRANFELGIAYLNLNRTEAALRWLKKAQELQPDPEVAAGLKALTSPATRRNAEPQVAARGSKSGNGAATPRAETADGPPTGKDDGANANVVLVVDDSATVRRMISMILERKGYRVVTAVDGEDGLNKFHEHPVDLVLLDVMMPKLDGYQVCKTIRGTNRALPIVMLSGKDGFFDKVRGRVAGSTLYMTKPFEADELLKTVAQYCVRERNPEIPS